MNERMERNEWKSGENGKKRKGKGRKRKRKE